jgi:hypothetical protein
MAVEDVLKTVVPGGLTILGIVDRAIQDSLVSRIRRAGKLIEQLGYY